MLYILERSETERHFAGVVNGIACYMQIKRLGFARECSNRSGDDFFFPFYYYRASKARQSLSDPVRNCHLTGITNERE